MLFFAGGGENSSIEHGFCAGNTGNVLTYPCLWEKEHRIYFEHLSPGCAGTKNTLFNLDLLVRCLEKIQDIPQMVVKNGDLPYLNTK